MKHPIESDCPKCMAKVGENCVGTRGNVRAAFHRERGQRMRRRTKLDRDDLKTESPIERLLLSSINEWLESHDLAATVETQKRFGPYRADIWIEQGLRKLVVECDGAAFHNSYGQIQHDKRRDRYCAVNGITVMRFTGSEINRDPRGCAASVGAWLRRRA